MTNKSGRGTARQSVRIDETLWERFGAGTEAMGTNRSTWLRDAIRWFLREPGAEMPHRPEQVNGQSDSDDI